MILGSLRRPVRGNPGARPGLYLPACQACRYLARLQPARSGLRPDDERAAAVHGLNQAALPQQGAGPPDRVVADAVLGGQFAFGRELGPGRQLTAGDPGHHVISDPDINAFRASWAYLGTISHKAQTKSSDADRSDEFPRLTARAGAAFRAWPVRPA